MPSPFSLPPHPTAALLAVIELPLDGEWRRKFVVALVALIVLAATLPRGRRRLILSPLALLALTPLPFAVALLFPESAGALPIAVDAARFFLLASLLVSAVLFVACSVWERVVRPLPRILLDVFRWLVVVVALLAILYDSGVNAGNLFTGSALVTAAVGLALKDTLGNVFSGLAIHAEHPFEVGDWIQYDQNPAHVGRVIEINWRATKVLTLDEAYVIIPNAQLALASIRNFTKPEPWSRRSLFVVTPYDVPPQRVQTLILEAIRGSFGVLEAPPPSVVTSDFKERGVEHWVRFFTTEFDKRDRVDGMARDRIWYAFARQGIELPVATHAVKLTQLPPPVVAAVAAPDERLALLRQMTLLAPLDESQLRQLAADHDDRHYAAGEQVVRQGDPGTSLFLILSGRVEVTARAADSSAVVLAALGPGDYFGEMSLMTGAARSATVTAVEETRLLEVGKESFRAILAARPGLVDDVGQALRTRLAERSRAIANAADRAASEQPADILSRIREFFSL